MADNGDRHGLGSCVFPALKRLSARQTRCLTEPAPTMLIASISAAIPVS